MLIQMQPKNAIGIHFLPEITIMSRSTITGRSQQIAVRIPFDVLEWLRERAGPCRGVAAAVKEVLRESYNKSGNAKSPRKRKKNAAAKVQA